MAPKSAETKANRVAKKSAGKPEEKAEALEDSAKGKAQKPEGELSDERYKKNREAILARKLRSRVSSGSIPWKTTVEKYRQDPTELYKTWSSNARQKELDDKTFEKAKNRFSKMGATVEE